ncbi:uncharacterized protein EDB91DRAFT_1081284 [Suillus paluster]|uniref:uncharacterized protein n=1 Tax=Suillus paluster TaxID=48578 RepID=UPI001B885214|nr:uncharacterized protein EDB91DRAFT_1081284 [Suillus paluster]KAG1742633.1 hypothetical protein EDB91DRAFT_1081284 [Suillus paluster]
MLANGIRLLIYAGNTVVMLVDDIGKTQFISDLDSMFHDQFLAAPMIPWLLNGSSVGEIRGAGGRSSTAGNVTLTVIFEVGHMSPYDQPAATLNMMMKWIDNVPIARG